MSLSHSNPLKTPVTSVLMTSSSSMRTGSSIVRLHRVTTGIHPRSTSRRRTDTPWARRNRSTESSTSLTYPSNCMTLLARQYG